MPTQFHYGRYGWPRGVQDLMLVDARDAEHPQLVERLVDSLPSAIRARLHALFAQHPYTPNPTAVIDAAIGWAELTGEDTVALLQIKALQGGLSFPATETATLFARVAYAGSEAAPVLKVRELIQQGAIGELITAIVHVKESEPGEHLKQGPTLFGHRA